MNSGNNQNPRKVQPLTNLDSTVLLSYPIEEARKNLKNLQPQSRLAWALKEFKEKFAITTSFGIQSSVLLHMLSNLKGGAKVPVIWIDTGYLPKETYLYAEELQRELELDIKVVQSPISPARMEALYGKLWETNSVEDLEKYHLIRKIQPLEKALKDLNVHCWASGVRGGQTQFRSSMALLDTNRGRLALRPLLEWSKKDVFYYMKENNLPQHPLFEKGFSTVGDWHSSASESGSNQGRETRFGGLQQECGIHLSGTQGEGI